MQMTGFSESKDVYLRMFSDKRVLIVEDEYFLADETRARLEMLGARIVGPTGGIYQALTLIQNEPVDAAILDIHIDGGLVFPVAQELMDRGIPFVFATGYDPDIIPGKFTGYALCGKPIELADIARALFGPQSRETRN